MPRPRRPIDPRAGTVLNKIEVIVEAVKTAEAAKLPFLISQAHEYGVSYEAIANRMGVSRQRVRRMERGR